MAYKILETIFVGIDELETSNLPLLKYVCNRLGEGSNHIKFVKIHNTQNQYLIEYHSIRNTNSFLHPGFFVVDENKIDLVSQYFLE